MRELSRTFSVMTEVPEQRPEGLLIAEALKRAKLSGRAAATAAGLSDGRWRQIVNGYQSVGGGNYFPVIGPPDTIARMAQVVNLTPDDLTKAGRPDAAEELSKLLGDETRDLFRNRLPATSGMQTLDVAGLRQDQVDALRELIRVMRSEVEG